MSFLARFSGAVRQSLVRQNLPHSVLRSTAVPFNNGLRYLSNTTTTTTTTTSTPFTNDKPSSGLSTATTVATTDDKSSEIVGASPSTALPVAYEDEYHNHGHRFMPGDPSKRAFTYLILGTTQFIAASAARVAILKLIYTMSASADVLALGSVEVDLEAIPLGESATIKWRGKPVFIRHRTEAEIDLAAKDDDADLRHIEADIDRVQKPEWLVVLGVCTHLGCVPIANAGDYQGWFCPCHGSHYDVSGRIRKGPAPLNLEVPSYRFIEDGAKMILG